MDYWGGGTRLALEYLLKTIPDEKIKISSGTMSLLLTNNMLMLEKRDTDRIIVSEEISECDYFITNFRCHPNDFPYPEIIKSFTVQNSTVLRIYKMH